MRVLLDECLPRRLKHELSAAEVSTVPEAGFAGLKDGRLLNAIEGLFDCFVTVDSGIEFQQQLRNRPFAIVVLRAATNRYIDLCPLMPALNLLLPNLATGEVRHLPESRHGA